MTAPSDKDMQLVQQLIEATNSGRITWEPTARPDEFTTSFKGKYSIIVANAGNRYTLKMLDDSEREMLRLDSQEVYSIEQLFELVRRKTLRVDEVLDDILQELNS